MVVWYDGNFFEALFKVKVSNACLLVFIEGKNKSSKAIASLLNNKDIIELLDAKNFLCMRFPDDTTAYVKFAKMYKFVPVPSIFFLGGNGQPLEIATELLQNVEELQKKIVNVLDIMDKIVTPSSSTTPTAVNTVTATNSGTCEGGACALPVKNPEIPETSTSNENDDDIQEVSPAYLAEVRRERKLREIREKLRYDKKVEQAARERVRELIDGDKRERAQLFKILTEATRTKSDENNTANSDVVVEKTKNANVVRLQFRMGNGNNTIHNFETTTTLGFVREYVRNELLANNKGKNFILATIYPKRELGIESDSKTLYNLSLSPSAVILVIIADTTNNTGTIQKHFNNLSTIAKTIFMTIISPLVSIAGYLGSFIGWHRQQSNNMDAVGQAKKNDGDQAHAALLAAQRRNAATAAANKFTASSNNASSGVIQYRSWAGGANVHRISDQRIDDDKDDNATWNGNSTQQQ